MLTEEEVEKMKNSENAAAWNANCDAIKKSHGGYPDDWYEKIVQSGILADTEFSWGNPWE